MSIFGTLIDDLNDKTVKGLSRYCSRTCFVIAALVVLVSCKEKKPEHILSQQEMVRVMTDIYIAEEKINRLGISRDSSEKVFAAMKEKVFENAALTDSSFKRSFDYYMENPKAMEQIYMTLVDSLQLREQRAATPFELE